MTDYTKLTKALRCCIPNQPETCEGCTYNTDGEWECNVPGMMVDAAAAIEELQAQLPKRGKWINSKERMRPDMCSVCGCVYEADRFMDKIAWNYCPNCGARMDGERREA